jgi:hypothetical protein
MNYKPVLLHPSENPERGVTLLAWGEVKEAQRADLSQPRDMRGKHFIPEAGKSKKQ